MKFVVFDGMIVSIRASAMDELGLRDGQNITESQLWECVVENLQALLCEMETTAPERP